MMDSALTIYTLMFHIAMLHTSTADDPCCAKPGIELTVDCTSIPGKIQWQWDSSTNSLFGFIINFNCKKPADENYCNKSEIRQVPFNQYNKRQSHSKTLQELEIPDNGSCWFWVEKAEAFVIHDDGHGCSNVVHCNISSPTISSSTEAKSTIGFIQSSVILDATSSVILDLISSVIADPTSLVSPSTTLVIAPYEVSTTSIFSLPSTSVIALYEVSTTSMFSLPSTSVIAPYEVSITSMFSLPSTSVTAIPLESQPTQIKIKILFFVTIGFIITLLMLSLTISLIVYWNKRKQREFKVSLNIPIEKECCKETDDIAKESDSEIEIVIDLGSEDEAVSITEDDLYIYNKILHWQRTETPQQSTPLALSQLSILLDSDTDDGSVHLSSDYYCTNSGSAGRHLKSNASNSQHETSLSSTPTVSIDNVKVQCPVYQDTL